MSASVEVVQVIRTQLLRRGDGVDTSPVRLIEQFWSFDGKLLAENDSWRMGALQRELEGDSDWSRERLLDALETARKILNS